MHESGEKPMKKNKAKEARVIQKEEGRDVFILNQSRMGAASAGLGHFNPTVTTKL